MSDILPRPHFYFYPPFLDRFDGIPSCKSFSYIRERFYYLQILIKKHKVCLRLDDDTRNPVQVPSLQ